MRKAVNGVLVSEYEQYNTCHACGLPLREFEGLVIIDNFFYHPNHQPAVTAVGIRPVAPLEVGILDQEFDW